MAAELGDTADPKELIPGEVGTVCGTAASMRGYGDVLHEAGAGLSRIDTSDGWSGQAADRFRDAFTGEPRRWLQAGDCFHDAAQALEVYAFTLVWAQQQAGEAIRLWQEAEAATQAAQAQHEQAVQHAQQQGMNGSLDGPPGPGLAFTDPGVGKRAEARSLLERARSQLNTAGETAADAVGRARDQAPQKPSFWQQAGAELAEAGKELGHAAGDLVNGLVSGLNATAQHPADVAWAAAGTALAAVGVTGEIPGTALSLSGVGAPIGIPIDIAATGAIGAGATMVAASTGDLGAHASGDDRVSPIDTSGENTGTAWDNVSGEKPNPADIHLPPAREIHILDGDGLGNGGHFPGTRIPGKTEFPEGWDEHKITGAIEDVAKNPDQPPELQGNGRYAVRGTRDGVDIKAIVSKDGEIRTGFPTGGDGVIQNPM